MIDFRPRPSRALPALASTAVVAGLLTLLVPAGVAAEPGGPLRAARHPISITQVDVFVNKNRMTVRCTFYADDLEMLYDIWPDEVTGIYDTEELREGLDIHAEFLMEKLEIVDAAGNRLPGKLVEKSQWDIPEAGIQSGELMDYSLSLTFEFDYDEPPEYLTFRHDITDPNFVRPSEVKLLVKQAGSDAVYAANMKVRAPETVRFDWDQPLSRTASGEELREWFDRQREETLGITSYGGVYLFIYITPHETRQEILIPVATLASELRIPQQDPSVLEVSEQEAARPLIEEFFRNANPLKINGQVVPPRFDRIVFGGLDIRDFSLQRDPKRISMANGRVGIIMSYPTRKIPDSVEITWTRFNQKFMRDVDVVIFTPGKTEKTQFSVFLADNTWSWTNPGLPPLPEVVPVSADASKITDGKTAVPVLSLVCLVAAGLVALLGVLGKLPPRAAIPVTLIAGFAALLAWGETVRLSLPGSQPPRVANDEAEGAMEHLLSNMFRAFEYSTEDDVYDALDKTTSGPLLKDIYLKMRKSLEIQEQGGAVSSIDKLEIVDGKMASRPAQGTPGAPPLEPPGFAWHCDWNLTGTVEHWGHIHQRTNRYEAIFNVQNVDGQWKFVDFQALDEQQGPVIRSLRKF